MNAHFNLLPDAVGSERLNDKHAILASLARRFATAYGLPEDDILEALEERERLGSTGFGRGVAIPHSRMDGISKPIAALVRLKVPIEFDAADGMPVELVFGLLSPTNSGVMHLYALAAISRLARDESMHEALLDAPDSEALYALLTNATDRDAA